MCQVASECQWAAFGLKGNPSFGNIKNCISVNLSNWIYWLLLKETEALWRLMNNKKKPLKSYNPTSNRVSRLKQRVLDQTLRLYAPPPPPPLSRRTRTWCVKTTTKITRETISTRASVLTCCGSWPTSWSSPSRSSWWMMGCTGLRSPTALGRAWLES